jgi:hypothetical protein
LISKRTNTVRTAALGAVLAITIACGGTSGLESFGIANDLMIKGKTAAERADAMMHQDRPDAAYVILRRHADEIDAAIVKIQKDPLINDLDKTKAVLILKEYRRSFQASVNQARRLMTFQSDLETRIRDFR